MISHPRKLLLFTFLSLADLALTWYLLRRGEGCIYESNPVAGWCLRASGWAGLVSFKILALLLVAALAAAISFRRQAAGGRVLTFACTAVTAVLLYSCALVRQVRFPADDRFQRVTAEARRWDQKLAAYYQYRAVLERLGLELSRGRRTLAEAAAELAKTERARDPRLLRRWRRRHPGWSDRALLADSLILDTVSLLGEKSHLAAEVSRRLRAEHRASFGVPPARRGGKYAVASRHPAPTEGRISRAACR
jgi:hypothetical protein